MQQRGKRRNWNLPHVLTENATKKLWPCQGEEPAQATRPAAVLEPSCSWRQDRGQRGRRPGAVRRMEGGDGPDGRADKEREAKALRQPL